MKQKDKTIAVSQAAFELANARGLPETRRSMNKELLMRFLLDSEEKIIIDRWTGEKLCPGEPELCQGNVERGGHSCDECDYFLQCFPECADGFIPERILCDAKTTEWFKYHPDDVITLSICERCGLCYKPSLGHECRHTLSERDPDYQEDERHAARHLAFSRAMMKTYPDTLLPETEPAFLAEFRQHLEATSEDVEWARHLLRHLRDYGLTDEELDIIADLATLATEEE